MAKVKTKAWRKNVSESLTGRKLSEEHKKHIKENHWSKNERYSSWNTGLTKKTDERVRNHSIILKEIWNKPEYIQFAKDRRAKIIYPTKDTSIEIKVQNFLKQLGIEFFTHQYMKQIKHGYQCDILIPSMNMVIECDGDYWHKYPVGNDIDHIRTFELLSKGFKVLRLWEFEIKAMDLNDFKKRIRVALVSKAELCLVYLF